MARILQNGRDLSDGGLNLPMCTVTFIAQRNGYSLGMNRDEKLTRADGMPPARREADGREVLSPSEPGGGTWIAVNDGGTSLALINWNAAAKRVDRGAISRGEVIKAVGAADSADLAGAKLRELPLKRINPFRLIGIFPDSAEIVEWRWNLKRLVRKKAAWRTQQWISSGFDERAAQRTRGKEFQRALQSASAPCLSWLRELHGSHGPRIGPFSTCMHRADARTVSYTEITVSAGTAAMRYHGGPPCQDSPSVERCLRLNAGRKRADHREAEAPEERNGSKAKLKGRS